MNTNYNNDKWADEMIEEIAEVVSVGQGFAKVLPEKGGSCLSCSSKTSCSSSSDSFSFLTGTRKSPRTIRVHNPVYAKPGDRVVVGVKPNTVLKGSILAYLVPLMALLVFATLGNILFEEIGMNAEAGSIMMGLLGLYVGFQLVAGVFKNAVIAKDFEAVILRVVKPEGHPISFPLLT